MFLSCAGQRISVESRSAMVQCAEFFQSPALSFRLHNVSRRARRATVLLPHGPVETPVFMPVGTNGAIKGLTAEQVEEIGPQIILSNTYHLGNKPGTDVLQSQGGLHEFMQWRRNILTDSGGFQMVSLLKLAEIEESGVSFSHPQTQERLVLTPERSMEIQNVIGADIMMALDDVVSSLEPDRSRVEEATHRTTRWLDRCIKAHSNPTTQNLFGIVQGGLHPDLRKISLSDLKSRDLPGYAIGGLSGGESKDDFWRMVELSTNPEVGLPSNRPRYLMGVGYPEDIVCGVAMGVDMFDCVYPTRTARFGTALIPEGTLRIKHSKYSEEEIPLETGCPCFTCCNFSRAFLHKAFSKTSASTLSLMTIHNLSYMFRLGAKMREAIETDAFPDFLRSFFLARYNPGETAPPLWIKDCLEYCGYPEVSDWFDWSKSSPSTEID